MTSLPPTPITRLFSWFLSCACTSLPHHSRHQHGWHLVRNHYPLCPYDGSYCKLMTFWCVYESRWMNNLHSKRLWHSTGGMIKNEVREWIDVFWFFLLSVWPKWCAFVAWPDAPWGWDSRSQTHSLTPTVFRMFLHQLCHSRVTTFISQLRTSMETWTSPIEENNLDTNQVW